MSHKKLYSFRLPIDLMEQLREHADQEETSVTQLVVRCIQFGLADDLYLTQDQVSDRLKQQEERSHKFKVTRRARSPQPDEDSQDYPFSGSDPTATKNALGSDSTAAEIKQEVSTMRKELDSLKEFLKAHYNT